MSTAGNATVCHGIIEDLDITGVGVRSTFYVTSFLLVVNACIPGCDVRGPFWTLIFTSLALLVSAIIQAANKTLSLYNAILVFYLCNIHCFSFLFVLDILRVVHRKNMDVILVLLSMMQIPVLYVFGALILGMKDFGSQPECNSRVHMTPLRSFWAFITPVFAMTRLIIDTTGADKVQTFLKKHEWKVFLPVFVFVWVSTVVSIEKTISIDLVIHNGPRFTTSFGQIFPVITIGIPISSIYFDARAWLQRRTIRGTPPMAAHDTLDMSAAVVYNNDAYLAYVMKVDEEFLAGADATTHSDATPALPPADTEIAASTTTSPPSGDEIETALDVAFGKIDVPTHFNTTPTLPPTPATDVTETLPRGLAWNRLSILEEADVQAVSSTLDVPSCANKATSNITTPSGEERGTELNTEPEFGRVDEVDVQIHASTKLAVSPADAEAPKSTVTMPPEDETKTTRTLDVMFGEVDTQTHSNITSTLPPATSAAEVTTSTTLPKDEGGPTTDVIRCRKTDKVDVRAPDSETETPEHLHTKVPTT